MINASAFYDLLMSLSDNELCDFINTLAHRIKFPNGGAKVIDYAHTQFGTVWHIDTEFFNTDNELHSDIQDFIYDMVNDMYSCHDEDDDGISTYTTAVELYGEMFNVN